MCARDNLFASKVKVTCEGKTKYFFFYRVQVKVKLSVGLNVSLDLVFLKVKCGKSTFDFPLVRDKLDNCTSDSCVSKCWDRSVG